MLRGWMRGGAAVLTGLAVAFVASGCAKRPLVPAAAAPPPVAATAPPTPAPGAGGPAPAAAVPHI
jgi:hypothetical protein